MKKLIILGVLIAGSTTGMPQIAAALGYPDFSIKESFETLRTSLDSVTRALGR